MTGTEILGAIGGLMAIATFVAAGFWRVWGLIKDAKGEVSLKTEAVGMKTDIVAAQLAEHRIHVAETYATREGVAKQVGEIKEIVNNVGDRVDKRFDGMNDRLDRMIEASHKPIPRRQS